MKNKLRFLKKHLIPLLVVFLFSKVKAESNDSAFTALEEFIQKGSLSLNSLNEKYKKAKMLLETGNYPKSLELGYNFTPDNGAVFGQANVRLYLSGTNLAHWSKFKLWDPELRGNGLNYPLQRTVNIGARVNL